MRSPRRALRPSPLGLRPSARAPRSSALAPQSSSPRRHNPGRTKSFPRSPIASEPVTCFGPIILCFTARASVAASRKWGVPAGPRRLGALCPRSPPCRARKICAPTRSDAHEGIDSRDRVNPALELPLLVSGWLMLAQEMHGCLADLDRADLTAIRGTGTDVPSERRRPRPWQPRTL